MMQIFQMTLIFEEQIANSPFVEMLHEMMITMIIYVQDLKLLN